MRKMTFLFSALVAIGLGTGCTTKETVIQVLEEAPENPITREWQPEQPIPFNEIKLEHFLPALQQGIQEQDKAIQAIKAEKTPNFKNTIEAFENSDVLVDRVNRVFQGIFQANRTADMEKTEQEIKRLVTQQSDKVLLDGELFRRIEQARGLREEQNPEQKRLTEEIYQRFIRNGGKLPAEGKAKLARLNLELAALTSQFGNNVMGAEKTPFSLEESKLGLPDDKKAEFLKDGKYQVPMTWACVESFLTHSTDRQSRKAVYEAWTKRGMGGEQNNCGIIENIVSLRAERAALLGAATHADLVLKTRMNQDMKKVKALMMGGEGQEGVLPLALKNLASDKEIEHLKRKGEFVELQAILGGEIPGARLEPWDYWHYAAKYKASKGFNEEEMKKYFELDQVRNAAFRVASRLWKIKFVHKPYTSGYHEDVKVYEVMQDLEEQEAAHLGFLYVDYYARTGTKEGGAWTLELRPQRMDNEVRIAPVVYTCCNFKKPAEGQKCLLSMNEVATLFHEFGHAMHGLLSQAQYKSLAGMNVPRDFVEMPAQMMEHYATHKSYLADYAKYEVDKEKEEFKSLIKDDAKLYKSYCDVSGFGKAFDTVEYSASALLDLEWHSKAHDKAFKIHDLNKLSPEQKKTLAVGSVQAFESKVREALLLKKDQEDAAIGFRHRSPNFLHIFNNTCDAGYYSSLWAEQYDCDAFALFEKKNIFNEDLAGALREFIYASGNTVDLKTQYGEFRKAADAKNGPEPDPIHMLRHRQLAAPAIVAVPKLK